MNNNIQGMINIANFRGSSDHPTQMYSYANLGLLEIYLIHSTEYTESNFICSVNILEYTGVFRSLRYVLTMFYVELLTKEIYVDYNKIVSFGSMFNMHEHFGE